MIAVICLATWQIILFISDEVNSGSKMIKTKKKKEKGLNMQEVMMYL